jgi:hypothetical protein
LKVLHTSKTLFLPIYKFASGWLMRRHRGEIARATNKGVCNFSGERLTFSTSNKIPYLTDSKY